MHSSVLVILMILLHTICKDLVKLHKSIHTLSFGIYSETLLRRSLRDHGKTKLEAAVHHN